MLLECDSWILQERPTGSTKSIEAWLRKTDHMQALECPILTVSELYEAHSTSRDPGNFFFFLVDILYYLISYIIWFTLVMKGPVKLTKHIEQVKSISTLTESKSSQVSNGLPPLQVRLQPSNNARALLDLILLSLKLRWKAISSHSQGLWRISICMLWARDLKAWPCLE